VHSKLSEMLAFRRAIELGAATDAGIYFVHTSARESFSQASIMGGSCRAESIRRCCADPPHKCFERATRFEAGTAPPIPAARFPHLKSST
jgi:hypothetical protein